MLRIQGDREIHVASNNPASRIRKGVLRVIEHTFSILNMRSISTPRPPGEDLNTPAKIRDAAIHLFAQDGFRKTSVRGIASAAGVSPGLVIHHFGSKDKLRATCDDYVLSALLARANAKSNPAGLQGLIREYLADPAEYNASVGYLGKAIAEDSPAGRKFMDIMTDETEAILKAGMADGTMREISDVRVIAAMLVMTSMSMLTMPAYLGRALGFDEFSPDMMKRMSRPMLELYTYGLYTNDVFLQAVDQALGDQPSTRKDSAS